MPKVRKSHPPSLKAKVAVEAIKAHKTAAQIAQMFGVHPTQVGGWKKQALAGLPDIFGNGRESGEHVDKHAKALVAGLRTQKRGDIVCYDDAARERRYMSDPIVNPKRDAQPNTSLSWSERWSLRLGRGRG